MTSPDALKRFPFWHRPMIPAAKGGMQWHCYDIRGETLCKRFQLIGIGKPYDARFSPLKDACKQCLSKSGGR